MPRRTREQKIIADLRRQLRSREAPKSVTPAVSRLEPTVTLPEAPIIEVRTVPEPAPSYLKGDLLRVGLVVTLAAALEFIFSYAVSVGTFRSLGIS